MPVLNSTIIIPNHRSVSEHADVVREYLNKELAANRMSGPFGREEMEAICRGPFYCSPLIVADDDKKRVCRHLSKGDKLTGTPSVNAYIDKEDFPTRFDLAFKIADMVSFRFPRIPLIFLLHALRRISFVLCFLYTRTLYPHRCHDSNSHGFGLNSIPGFGLRFPIPASAPDSQFNTWLRPQIPIQFAILGCGLRFRFAAEAYTV